MDAMRRTTDSEHNGASGCIQLSYHGIVEVIFKPRSYFVHFGNRIVHAAYSQGVVRIEILHRAQTLSQTAYRAKGLTIAHAYGAFDLPKSPRRVSRSVSTLMRSAALDSDRAEHSPYRLVDVRKIARNDE
jgi:hypothetical protein